MFLVLHILVKSKYHMTCRLSQAVPMVFIPHQMPNNKKLHKLKKKKKKFRCKNWARATSYAQLGGGQTTPN
jgi:hypothetical protein